MQILRDYLSGRVLGKPTTRYILFLPSGPRPGPLSLVSTTESQGSKNDRCDSESASRGQSRVEKYRHWGGANEDGGNAY